MATSIPYHCERADLCPTWQLRYMNHWRNQCHGILLVLIVLGEFDTVRRRPTVLSAYPPPIFRLWVLPSTVDERVSALGHSESGRSWHKTRPSHHLSTTELEFNNTTLRALPLHHLPYLALKFIQPVALFQLYLIFRAPMALKTRSTTINTASGDSGVVLDSQYYTEGGLSVRS